MSTIDETTTEPQQMSGKVSYDLGLTAVIDLDQDPTFAQLSETHRRVMVASLGRKLIQRADEYFDDFAGIHKVTGPEWVENDTAADDVAQLREALGLSDHDDDQEDAS